MKKYIYKSILFVFLVLLGVGILKDSSLSQDINYRVSELENNIKEEEIVVSENDEMVKDYVIDSNVISRTNAFIASSIVKVANYFVRLGLKLVNGLTQ